MNVPQTFAAALRHHQAGRLAEAEALYRQILAVEPRHAEAWHHLGLIASQMNCHDLALQWIREATDLAPGNPAAHGNLGEIYRTTGRLDDAIASFRRALEITPDATVILNNLGLALMTQGRLQEAAAQFRRAIELQPDLAIAHHNLGVALDEKGRKHVAIAAYRRALELKPDYADAWNNLGSASNDLGQYEEALTAYRQALRAQPDHNCAKHNLSLLLLLRGDFEQGWPLLESRWAALDYPPRSFSQPRWEGGPVKDKRLLIHAEQGLGDAIQFIRYAPLIATRGAEIIVECQPPLVELFRTVPGLRGVVALGETLPPFDLHAPLLSLPLALQTSLETIPHDVPYLFADAVRREVWRERFGQKQSPLRVGLAWAGNPEKERLRKRHIAVEKLAPLLQVPEVDFFSLQLGAEQLQQWSPSFPIIDHTQHLRDFADTAAFLAELDLIISVDTAVAHLAGALGKPVWTLLPFVPDWRWGLNSEQTPWYPTMRLFRQPALGNWETVMDQVATALRRQTAIP